MILYVVEGNEYKLSKNYNKINGYMIIIFPNIVNYCWGINYRKYIDKYFTIGLEAYGGSMNVDAI